MGHVTHWSNVSGHFSTELRPESLTPELWEEVATLLYDYSTLEVDFISTGYYDPGHTYGDPDRCYQPAGSDDRELVDAWLNGETETLGILHDTRIDLTRDLQEKLFEHFAEQIQEVEIVTEKTQTRGRIA